MSPGAVDLSNIGQMCNACVCVNVPVLDYEFFVLVLKSMQNSLRCISTVCVCIRERQCVPSP